MLLVQASKDISQPGQAYKMRILEEIVNRLNFIIILIWWSLRPYLFGHFDQWYEWSNWSQHLKNYLFRNLFHTFQSLGSWPIGSRVITGFLQLLGSLGSLVFYLFFVSSSFAYTFRNPVSMGLRAKTSDKNPKPIYAIKSTSSFWMAALISYSMAWSVRSPKFICLYINFLHCKNQRISDPFSQTNSP